MTQLDKPAPELPVSDAHPVVVRTISHQHPLVFTQAVADLREGWGYMVAPGNRDVAAFTLIKASSALVWGASDVLYVK